MLPIRTGMPGSCFSALDCVDELGSPVCDFRQWADLGVRGRSGRIRSVGIRRAAEPRYTSIITGQNVCQLAIAIIIWHN